MLNVFENWLCENREMFKSIGYEVDLNKSPLDISNPSVRLDLDSDKYIARITIWETGDCCIEVIDIESELTIMDSHLMIENSERMGDNFTDFINLIKD